MCAMPFVRVIELYQQRIQWLLQDSRKVFGLIKGTKVGLMVDVSHMSYGPQLLDFQKDLLCLIDEQLCYKKQLYCLSFSTEISSLWESPKNINVHVLHEARQWIQQLEPGQGCNLLKALKHVFMMKELNSLVFIVGSCPDQPLEILSDYAQQCMLGRKLQTHAVTYDCSNPASLVSNCFKTYFLKCPVIFFLFSCNIFSHKLEGKLTYSLKKFANTTPSNFLPKPPNHEGPLIIQTPCVLAKTSADWLKTYGLKAKKLNLYQVLAPNAFSPVEEFIPILKKTVSSTLHEKAMMQFEWYDGTVKNIHVDLPALHNYQKLLAKMVRIYEKRIDWLSVASRRIWGNVIERRVVILVDISATNSMYSFKIIVMWVLRLQCKGSRNFMCVLRRAVEVDFKDKDKHKSQGLYLLTTGIPDQETHTISAYVAEVCRGFDLQLHVCLFSLMEDVDSNGIIPARYASQTETAIAFKEIVQAANGRFHWFGEADIFESDDVTIIVSEMEKANNYSQKVRIICIFLSYYSIKKLKLELPRLMFGPSCTHRKKTVESLHKKVSAKYCTIFPSVEINGVVKHLQVQPKELEIYTEQLEKVLQRYVERIQWLLSGSRRLFGTILEANVCVLIDASGSMEPYLPHITKELTSLIWEQLRKNEVRFNLLRFAKDTESWKECLVGATDETCHDAVQWVSKFHAHGNTCILTALRKALSFQGIEALYLLTDGKPDTSCSLILKETERLRKKQDIKIHTISFSCTDRYIGANEFLKKLAYQTGGRYHCSSGDVDGQLAAHRMLTEGLDDEDDPVFPYFEGDDLKKLTEEIAKARSFLKQAKSLRWNIYSC
uniref:von Willebrand factor A domain containing 3A n=1 Tax=Falco tinnunculus TaxID=100819 RepID=A0A8C4VER7_FALTI